MDTDWTEHHTRNRKVVSAMYGGIDRDVFETFFSLEPQQLDHLFKIYKAKYGSSASLYARKTYSKWKSGNVEPNGQTAERLILTLPQLLDFDAKCGLLRKLRRKLAPKEDYELAVNSGN